MFLKHSEQERAPKLRRFLRHIIIASGKISESKQALLKVDRQLERVRSVSKSDASEQDLEQEIKKLREHIFEFIQKDKKLKGYHYTTTPQWYISLQGRLDVLESKLQRYMDIHQKQPIKTIKPDQ